MTAYRRAAVALALSAFAAVVLLTWTYGGPQVRVTWAVVGAGVAWIWWTSRD